MRSNAFQVPKKASHRALAVAAMAALPVLAVSRLVELDLGAVRKPHLRPRHSALVRIE